MRDDHTISLKYEPRPEPPIVPPPPPPPRMPQRPRQRWPRPAMKDIIVFGVIIAILGGGFYAWWSWSDWMGESGPSETRDDAEPVDTSDIIGRVGELIVLPEGEDPTIATVTDPEKLRDQVFFANAKEGDVVLIYTKAQKAYLYDPEAHKLVEVAPLTIQ